MSSFSIELLNLGSRVNMSSEWRGLISNEYLTRKLGVWIPYGAVSKLLLTCQVHSRVYLTLYWNCCFLSFKSILSPSSLWHKVYLKNFHTHTHKKFKSCVWQHLNHFYLNHFTYVLSKHILKNTDISVLGWVSVMIFLTLKKQRVL